MYNDEIIQIAGGLNDYIGKLDKGPHPLGEGWFRIKDPCLTFLREDPQNKRINTVVARLSGAQGNAYRKYVDIYIPDCMPMEIRTLDKKGQLYKTYKKEIDRISPTKIIVPNLQVHSN